MVSLVDEPDDQRETRRDDDEQGRDDEAPQAYCYRCGAPVDVVTVECPRCGAALVGG